jgi:hypothetical protein
MRGVPEVDAHGTIDTLRDLGVGRCVPHSRCALVSRGTGQAKRASGGVGRASERVAGVVSGHGVDHERDRHAVVAQGVKELDANEAGSRWIFTDLAHLRVRVL